MEKKNPLYEKINISLSDSNTYNALVEVAFLTNSILQFDYEKKEIIFLSREDERFEKDFVLSPSFNLQELDMTYTGESFYPLLFIEGGVDDRGQIVSLIPYFSYSEWIRIKNRVEKYLDGEKPSLEGNASTKEIEDIWEDFLEESNINVYSEQLGISESDKEGLKILDFIPYIDSFLLNLEYFNEKELSKDDRKKLQKMIYKDLTLINLELQEKNIKNMLVYEKIFEIENNILNKINEIVASKSTSDDFKIINQDLENMFLKTGGRETSEMVSSIPFSREEKIANTEHEAVDVLSDGMVFTKIDQDEFDDLIYDEGYEKWLPENDKVIEFDSKIVFSYEEENITEYRQAVKIEEINGIDFSFKDIGSGSEIAHSGKGELSNSLEAEDDKEGDINKWDVDKRYEEKTYFFEYDYDINLDEGVPKRNPFNSDRVKLELKGSPRIPTLKKTGPNIDEIPLLPKELENVANKNWNTSSNFINYKILDKEKFGKENSTEYSFITEGDIKHIVVGDIGKKYKFPEKIEEWRGGVGDFDHALIKVLSDTETIIAYADGVIIFYENDNGSISSTGEDLIFEWNGGSSNGITVNPDKKQKWTFFDDSHFVYFMRIQIEGYPAVAIFYFWKVDGTWKKSRTFIYEGETEIDKIVAGYPTLYDPVLENLNSQIQWPYQEEFDAVSNFTDDISPKSSEFESLVESHWKDHYAQFHQDPNEHFPGYTPSPYKDVFMRLSPYSDEEITVGGKYTYEYNDTLGYPRSETYYYRATLKLVPNGSNPTNRSLVWWNKHTKWMMRRPLYEDEKADNAFGAKNPTLIANNFVQPSEIWSCFINDKNYIFQWWDGFLYVFFGTNTKIVIPQDTIKIWDADFVAGNSNKILIYKKGSGLYRINLEEESFSKEDILNAGKLILFPFKNNVAKLLIEQNFGDTKYGALYNVNNNLVLNKNQNIIFPEYLNLNLSELNFLPFENAFFGKFSNTLTLKIPLDLTTTNLGSMISEEKISLMYAAYNNNLEKINDFYLTEGSLLYDFGNGSSITKYSFQEKLGERTSVNNALTNKQIDAVELTFRKVGFDLLHYSTPYLELLSLYKGTNYLFELNYSYLRDIYWLLEEKRKILEIETETSNNIEKEYYEKEIDAISSAVGDAVDFLEKDLLNLKGHFYLFNTTDDYNNFVNKINGDINLSIGDGFYIKKGFLQTDKDIQIIIPPGSGDLILSYEKKISDKEWEKNISEKNRFFFKRYYLNIPNDANNQQIIPIEIEKVNDDNKLWTDFSFIKLINPAESNYLIDNTSTPLKNYFPANTNDLLRDYERFDKYSRINFIGNSEESSLIGYSTIDGNMSLLQRKFEEKIWDFLEQFEETKRIFYNDSTYADLEKIKKNKNILWTKIKRDFGDILFEGYYTNETENDSFSLFVQAIENFKYYNKPSEEYSITYLDGSDLIGGNLDLIEVGDKISIKQENPNSPIQFKDKLQVTAITRELRKLSDIQVEVSSVRRNSSIIEKLLSTIKKK